MVVVVFLSCRTSKATTTTTNSTTTFRGGVSVHAVRGRWWSPQSVARPYSKTNPPSYHTRLFFLCEFRYKNPEILLSSLLCYIKRGKRESRASPPPPPKKARVTCVWKVLVVVVIFCVRALLVLPRFLHSNRAHGDENDARILEAKFRGKNFPFSHRQL